VAASGLAELLASMEESSWCESRDELLVGRLRDWQRHPPPAGTEWPAAMIANAFGEAAVVDAPEQPPVPASEAGRGGTTTDAEVTTEAAELPSAHVHCPPDQGPRGDVPSKSWRIGRSFVAQTHALAVVAPPAPAAQSLGAISGVGAPLSKLDLKQSSWRRVRSEV
jgi:hypothetical protein